MKIKARITAGAATVEAEVAIGDRTVYAVTLRETGYEALSFPEAEHLVEILIAQALKEDIKES